MLVSYHIQKSSLLSPKKGLLKICTTCGVYKADQQKIYQKQELSTGSKRTGKQNEGNQ